MTVAPVEEPYDRVIPTLLNERRDFKISEDYRLLMGTGEDLPGVVACAYARWLSNQIITDREAPVAELFHPLNLLASLKDGKVEAMLHDEVLEEFDTRGLLQRIEPWMNRDFMDILERYMPIQSR